jgi:hypothetical protein
VAVPGVRRAWTEACAARHRPDFEGLKFDSEKLNQQEATAPSADALFGSGLRRRYVNSDHLPSYLTVNRAAHRGVEFGAAGTVDLQLSLLNVLDRVYELRDGSGVGAPQWGMRRTCYIGLSKPLGR